MNFVFLVCSERSGSNLITAVMNGHSDISGPPPSHLFRLFATNAARYPALQDDENWSVLVSDFKTAFNAMLGSWNTPFDAALHGLPPERRSVAALLEHVYRREAQSDNAQLSFVKENYTYKFWRFLVSNWPDCKFVHQVRDPRDVAASWLNTDGIKGGVKEAIDAWLRDQRATREACCHPDFANRLLQVKYEDLVHDPRQTTARLCRHANVRFDPAMLNFNADSRTVRNAGRIDAWTNLARPITATGSGHYHDRLSADDLAYIESRCRDTMIEYDYLPETVCSIESASALEAQIQQLENRLTPARTYALKAESEQQLRRRRERAIDVVLSRPIAG